MFVYLCLCWHYKPDIFQPYSTVIQRRGRRLPDSFIYTLPVYIHPKNLFIHSALCRSLFVEIHSYRFTPYLNKIRKLLPEFDPEIAIL
jgi:hypothetical protein